MNCVENLVLFPAVENFENPLRIDEIIAMSLVYYFLGHSVLLVVYMVKWLPAECEV